jgi:plasmid stabilization system protein ParE
MRQVVSYGDWYAENAGIDVARQMVSKISDAGNDLSTFPLIYPRNERVGYRRRHVHRFPLVIWYHTDEDSHEVRLLAVTHNKMSDERIKRSLHNDPTLPPLPSSILPRLSAAQTKRLLDAALKEAQADPETSANIEQAFDRLISDAVEDPEDGKI